MRQQTIKYNRLSNDMQRYMELHTKLFPDGAMFVEQTNSEEWREFNLLCIKLTPAFKLMYS